MKKREKHCKDLIFAGMILTAGIVSARIFYGAGSPRGKVVVTLSGEEVAEFPLNRDREYLIESRNGGTNLLIIEDGSAYIKKADCASNDCVKTGKIRENGEIIVCLPHELIIQVE